MSIPSTRKRIAAHQIVVGGLARIMQGVFGSPTAPPDSGRMDQQIGGSQGYYHFHEGDLFTPGTAIWAADPVYDGPVNPIWGGGFLCGVNQFNPFATLQASSNPSILTYGPGGVVAGQLALQPLFPVGRQNG